MATIEVPDELHADLMRSLQVRHRELEAEKAAGKPNLLRFGNPLMGGGASASAPVPHSQPHTFHPAIMPVPAPAAIDDMQMANMGQMVAQMLAEAFRDLREGLRPNGSIGLISATQPVLTVASSACTQVQIPTDAQVVGLVSSDNDGMFTWSSLSIDTFQLVKAGQVPNDIAARNIADWLATVPFANRVFESAVNVDGTIVNQSGSSAYHHGLAVLYIDSRCAPLNVKIRPRDAFASVMRVKERVQRFIESAPVAVAQRLSLW